VTAELPPTQSRKAQAARRRLDVVETRPFPAYVVWELTLACDHACLHCGSRAARARENELSTAQALEVVGELAALGTKELVFIGGEAYLHPGFLELVAAARSHDIVPAMTTGGAGIDETLAFALKRGGMARVSVSIDGLEASHDRVRKRGSYASAMRALALLRAAGVDLSVNTTVNRLNLPDLEALYDELLASGVRSWQIQLAVPLGRAADHPELLLQPFELLELLPRVDALKRRGLGEGLLIMPGNNLGYFGPEELRLRSQNARATDHFQGCQAGRFVMGIESDGGVKGCPSLPSRGYVGGRFDAGTSVRAIWEKAPELGFTRGDRRAELWGRCKDCEFAELCLGGCSFTAHSLFGRRGNNPYCHHRALVLAGQGLRERLVRVEAAPGNPFDHGRFEIVEEALDAPLPLVEPERLRLTVATDENPS
jgi:radical SAM protein with 4Fe4S-binding SPASM domain